MQKKLIVAALGAVISFGAFADMPSHPQGGGERGPRGGGDMMASLTDEQKSCIEQYGCTMPDKPAQAERGEKPAPGSMPEMSAEQKEAMECMQNAMKACGVEMPERPQGGKPGEKPQGVQPRQ